MTPSSRWFILNRLQEHRQVDGLLSTCGAVTQPGMGTTTEEGISFPKLSSHCIFCDCRGRRLDREAQGSFWGPMQPQGVGTG